MCAGVSEEIIHKSYESIIRFDDYRQEPTSQKAMSRLRPNQYVLSEKVHGSNCNIYVTVETFQLYSRRQPIDINSKIKFFNFADYIDKDEFKISVEAAKKYVADNINEIDCIRLVGEYFGGKGQKNEEDAGTPKGLAVQKDNWVEYCWENRLVIFDVAVRRSRDGSWKFLYYRDAREVATSLGFEFVPVLTVCETWDGVRDFICRNSPDATRSKLRGANHAYVEGFVVRRYAVSEDDPSADPVPCTPHLKYTRLSVTKFRVPGELEECATGDE